MPDTHVTITGNLTDDPEVTFTPNGAAVCNFRVAVTARIKDGDALARRRHGPGDCSGQAGLSFTEASTTTGIRRPARRA